MKPKPAQPLRRIDAQGLVADVAIDADEAMWTAPANRDDVIMLDVMLRTDASMRRRISGDKARPR